MCLVIKCVDENSKVRTCLGLISRYAIIYSKGHSTLEWRYTLMNLMLISNRYEAHCQHSI